MRHPDRQIESKKHPVNIQDLFNKNEPEKNKEIEFDVECHKSSSDSLVALSKYIIVLVPPNDKKESELKDESYDKEHNSSQSEGLLFGKSQCVSEKQIEVRKVPSCVYCYCVDRKSLGNLLGVRGFLYLANHFVNEKDAC